MSQQGERGGLNRDELKSRLDAERLNSAMSQAQVVDNRQPAYPKQADEILDAKNVRGAVNNMERAVVQRLFWAIVSLTTGEKVLHSAENRRPSLPTTAQILEDKAPFGIYNSANIISIQVFGNEDQANEEFARLKAEKESDNESLVSKMKKSFSK